MINGDKIHQEIIKNNKKQSLKRTKKPTEKQQQQQKPKQNTTEFVHAINKTDPAPTVTFI